MTYFDEHINYDLLAKHFAGETNAEEENKIKADLKDNLFLKQYETLKEIWQQTGSFKQFKSFDPVSAKLKVKEKISGQEQNFTFKRPGRTYLRIAAVIIILALSSFIAYTFFIGKTNDLIVQTGENEKIEITLPDGTIAYLNEYASISYPQKFTGKTREIELTGEAFFDVAENKKRPFIIQAFDTEIQVLGTSFNINASNKKVEVIVETGKVKFTGKGNDMVSEVLNIGEKGSYIKNKGNILKEKNLDPNYNSWKTEKIIFEEVFLSEVFNTLRKLYDIEFKFKNDALKDCRLTASFNNQSINSIIEIIRQSHDLEIENKNNVYYISGTDCY